MKFKIFIDFDGTITRQDSLVYLLDKHTGSTWRKIEDMVTEHLIDEKIALQREFDLFHIDIETALQDLSNFPIDPHFNDFVDFCDKNAISITILSGGIDIFIKKILQQHGLGHLSFLSNSVSVTEKKWHILPADSPRIKNKCNHCKTYWLQKANDENMQTIYIGDGNTDRCPAEKANIRFAKNELAEYFDKKGIPYLKYQNFSHIQVQLTKILTDWEKSWQNPI